MADKYSHLPERFRVAQQYRAQVIARENEAVQFLARSWEKSMRAISVDIDKVTRKIEDARKNGKVINRDWLRRQSEYRQMQSQIISMARKYSNEVADKLREETEWSARKGAHDADKVTQLAFDTNIRSAVNFTVLPEETILSVAARVAPGSPMENLLKKIGPDTATKAQQILVDGLVRGRNVRVIGRELRDASGIPGSRAMTIARTEIFGAYRDSHHEHMQANADILQGWVWMAQLGTACGGCLAKHGEVHTLEVFLEAHPNCACEPIAVPKTFAAMGLPSFLDDKYPDPFDPDVMKRDALKELDVSQKELAKRFGPGKAAGLKSGKIKLPQLAKRVENDIWGASITETPLKELI